MEKSIERIGIRHDIKYETKQEPQTFKNESEVEKRIMIDGMEYEELVEALKHLKTEQHVEVMSEFPPHWRLDFRNSLTEILPDRWIGRGGQIWWPPRSPDITPLDFFLWSYVKDRVFASPVQDLQDLRTRIRDIIATVSMDMLDRTWNELEYILHILRATTVNFPKTGLNLTSDTNIASLMSNKGWSSADIQFLDHCSYIRFLLLQVLHQQICYIRPWHQERILLSHGEPYDFSSTPFFPAEHRAALMS
ncbi:hypothetical protein ANN_17574 [Periplaneta americana]|uniref:Uncharacterized protein n=1 Tax=Periplaneta americana TaxID=6978 RepID=A0ABQ8SVF6_PERAM|nr:hypothetical protein ANN_17574 [Periplaneta americana]